MFTQEQLPINDENEFTKSVPTQRHQAP